MTRMQKVSKSNLSETVYQSLRNALMDGQFEAGDRIKIGQMAKELDVSITPVREAIFRLVSEKALVMKAATAVHVSEPNARDLRQIKSIRLALEGDTAAAAAKVADKKLICRLERIQEDFLEALVNNPKRASLLNRKFHFVLADAAQLEIVTHVIATMWAMMGPTLSEFHREMPTRDLIGEHKHEAVLDALRRRDPEAARLAIQADINWSDIIIQWIAERD